MGERPIRGLAGCDKAEAGVLMHASPKPPRLGSCLPWEECLPSHRKSLIRFKPRNVDVARDATLQSAATSTRRLADVRQYRRLRVDPKIVQRLPAHKALGIIDAVRAHD